MEKPGKEGDLHLDSSGPYLGKLDVWVENAPFRVG